MTEMMSRQKLQQALPAIERYASTVLAVVCTVAIRLVFDPVLADRAPYLFFVLTIVIVKRLWGRGPSLLATLLGGISAWYFIIEPRFSFAYVNRVDALNLAAYFAVGASISFLGKMSSRWAASRTVRGRNIKPRVIRHTAVLAGAAVVLAGMVLLLLRDFGRARDAEGRVAHTYQVMNSADSVLSLMKDAETGERGFLLTGDETYLAPYNSAIAALPRGLKELKDLTSDNPQQQARYHELSRLTGERLSVLKHAIELRKSSGVDAALALVRYGRGEPAMDKLRSTLDDVMGEERRLLAERTAKARVEDSRERWVLGLGSTALILLLVFASVVIERETARREEITQALGRHADLLEQAHDSLITWPLGGAINYWSRGAEILYGYAREEAVGRFGHELLHTDHPLGMTQIDALLQRDAQWKGELTQTTKEGRKLIVESQWTLAVDAEGNKTVLEANRDITARKQAEAQNLLLATAIEQAAETVVITDRDATIQYVNPAFTRITGYTRGEALGQNPRILKSGQHDAKFYEELWATVTAGKLWRGEFTNRRKDGTLYMEEATMAPVRDASGKITNFIAIKYDITERKRAEEALRQSEEHFRSLFDNMLNGFAHCQMLYEQNQPSDFIYLNVNKAFEVLTGLKNVEGKKVSQVIPGIREADPELLAIYGRVASTGVSERFETYVEALAMWFSIAVYSPKKDHFVAVFDVITERKRAEMALRESEMMLRFFVQHAPAAIAMLDREMRYLVVSQRWMADYRLGNRDLWGLSHYEVFPEMPKRWKKIHQRCLAGAVERCEEDPFPRLDGTVDWVRWEARPWRKIDDSVGGIIIFSELITERKRAEEEIRTLNSELEQRVRSRTAELEAANRELEAFAHSVSHDLRAPLRGIDGWSLALLEDYGGCLDAQGQKYLDRVRSEAQRMGKLIDDLLHLSRVGRAELVPTTVDLTSLAETIVARLKESRPDRSIEFVVAPQLKCTGDARLLEIALTNLLDNAMKFTGARNAARVEFGEREYEGNPAFFVRDNGVGFDMAYAGMLFGPFQRLHKASEFPGTGIGLATVQRVIHRHGGRIWAEAQVGAGATLYFTLGADK
ncbi:MAG TPA: PAS domain S-box protein [Terriglobia bacterium]|nr:PAS domain S-box protein [Terriglobia bacterium]